MLVDTIVLAAILLSAVVAFLRGLIREVLTILGVGGALLGAFFIAPHVIPLIEGWLMGGDPAPETGEAPKQLFDIVPVPLAAMGLGYTGVFILILIVLSIISHFLSDAAKSIGLGPIDRSLGVLFGLARGVFLLGLLYLPVHLLVDSETKASWFSDSKTHIYVAWTAEKIAAFLPDSSEEGTGTPGEGLLQETRQRLQELELLREDESGTPAPRKKDTPQNGESGADPDSGSGYSPRQRQKIDQLFEDATTP